MNIRFEYLYRDAGNFKQWGEVVFANPGDISVDAIASTAEPFLIDHLFFVASKVGVPDLHFAAHFEELDHGWHEVHAFLDTDDPPTDARARSVDEFVDSLRSASRR
jgi:hypothetical protein